jgi:hypothetical protein
MILENGHMLGGMVKYDNNKMGEKGRGMMEQMPMTMFVMTRLMMVEVEVHRVGQQLLGKLEERGGWYQMAWYRPDYWALLQLFQI